MGHKPFDDVLLKVRRGTWRTTILRLIRAEQDLDNLNTAFDQYIALRKEQEQKLATRILELARESGESHKAGQEDVLKLIARWGKCRPLEGYNGEQMAEALRKVVVDWQPSYNDYKGITQATTDDLGSTVLRESDGMFLPKNKGII